MDLSGSEPSALRALSRGSLYRREHVGAIRIAPSPPPLAHDYRVPFVAGELRHTHTDKSQLAVGVSSGIDVAVEISQGDHRTVVVAQITDVGLECVRLRVHPRMIEVGDAVEGEDTDPAIERLIDR